MILRIVRDDRGWYFVRLTFLCAPHAVARAAIGLTLKAAVWRYRQARREAWASETAL